jgi:hypothetical protein
MGEVRHVAVEASRATVGFSRTTIRSSLLGYAFHCTNYKESVFMKQLKRYLALVGLVAFVAFCVGCGGSSDKPTAPTPTPPDVTEEVTATPKAGNTPSTAEEPVVTE